MLFAAYKITFLKSTFDNFSINNGNILFENNQTDGYNINNGDTKILFLGSCRMVMLCIYIMEYVRFNTTQTFGFSILTDYHYKLLKKFESPMDPKIKEIVKQ